MAKGHRARRTPDPAVTRALYDRHRDLTCDRMDAFEAGGRMYVSPAIMDRMRVEFGRSDTNLPAVPMPLGIPIIVTDTLPTWTKKPTRRTLKRAAHRERAREVRRRVIAEAESQRREREWSPIRWDFGIYSRNLITIIG